MKILTKILESKNRNLNTQSSSRDSETISNKAAFIETSLNKMYLALFEQTIEKVKTWNVMRNEIIEDLNEVLRKRRIQFKDDEEKYQEDNFNFSGFQDDINFKNENLIAFFEITKLKEQIVLNYRKHTVSKNGIIDLFISIANEHHIIESAEISDYALKNSTEKWKQELYQWIGEIVEINSELIRVILERFEFKNLEKQTINSYTAWYKYFDKHASIPVKIILKEKEEKEIFEIENPQDAWFYTFLKAIYSFGSILVVIFVAVVINCKGILLKLASVSSGSIAGSSWQRIPSTEYELLPSEYLTDNIANDLHDNIVAIGYNQPIRTERVLIEALSKFKNLKKTAFFSESKMSNNNQEKRIDLSAYSRTWDSKFDKAFENVTIIEHNLSFLKWGIFDTIRYGKMRIADFPDQFLFKIERKNFNPPSQVLINKFYENITKMFEKIYISKNDVNIKNAFAITSKIFIEVLTANSPVIIFDSLYFFSADSFWIEDVKFEDEFIGANLRHPLFFDPLTIKIAFFADYIDDQI